MNAAPDALAHPDCRALSRIGTQVRERLSTQPNVRRYPVDRAEIYGVMNFFPATSCRRLMKLIDAVACPSALAGGDGEWSGYRTSSSGDFDTQHDIVRNLEARITAITGLMASHGEAAQGQRYLCGQHFHEHCDWFDTSAGYWPEERRCGGQRSWTAMVYLNAVEDGGMTDFTRLSLHIAPRAGTLVLWNNALPDGTPNPWTMHAGRPVMKGAKYVVTKWFRASSATTGQEASE